MLIEFNVKNYLSFKEKVTLSMFASFIKEHDNNNVFKDSGFRLLKSAVIYGANASGKSNLINAMAFMKDFVYNSAKESQATEKIKVDKFRLSTEVENEPSYFEVTFIQYGIRYRYGFEVNVSNVQREWLYYVPKGKEAKLFTRNLNQIEIGSYFKEGKGLQEKTRGNALFLSVVAQFNGEISVNILEWFSKFNIISGLKNEFTRLSFMNNYDNNFMKFIKIADLGIENVLVETQEIGMDEFPSLPQNLLERIKIKKHIVKTQHKKFDNDGNFISLESFDLNESESEGTKKLFFLAQYILDALEQGDILVIDELEAKMHPLITRFIINLFHSNNVNNKNAQLIFATHDTNLLSRELFRRDQIWFAEKDKYGCTALYSLVEYNIRKDASFQKDYIIGKYGAIPFIGNFDDLLEQDEVTMED